MEHDAEITVLDEQGRSHAIRRVPRITIEETLDEPQQVRGWRYFLHDGEELLTISDGRFVGRRSGRTFTEV